MRGIKGIVQFRQTLDSNAMKKIVCTKSNYKTVYTDEQCSLGVQMHSITTLEANEQLVWNEKRNKCIVFHGEIYNHKELQKIVLSKGYTVSTNLDAEIVLFGVESCGIDFFAKIEGMFVCVIYDLQEQTWILARDRVGGNPLYYFCNNECFLFGTEIKDLLVTGLIPKEVDKEALSRYLQLTYIPAPKSIIKNISKLMPATVLSVDIDGNISSQSYWELEIGSDNPVYEDYEECKKMLRASLFSSVEKQMVGNDSIGAFLSGGFDSTIVVGIMSQISDKPINTFTVGFQEKQYDESGLAQLVANKNHTNHRVLPLDWERTVDNIDTILDNMDEPYADSSLIALYAISKMTRDYVKVALTGDAGDELFAGYNKYLVSYYRELYNMIPRFLKKGVIEPAAKLLPTKSAIARKVNKMISVAYMDIYEQRKVLMSLGFKAEELRKMMIDGFVDPMDFIKEQYNTFINAEEQTRAQYVDFKTVLEGDMMTKVYRASTMTSLKTKSPILNNDVMELAFKMPAKFKINKTERKIILKDTFREFIPDELFNAPKHGFAVPIGNWLENNLKHQLYKYADEEFLREQGLFDVNYIRMIIDLHMKGKENRYSELWAFYVFQHWYVKNFL